MAKYQPYNNYSFADIERYLQNSMSATERHLMEKAALQDPFLSDAIEGYEEAFLVTAKEHLTSITNKLSQQQEEKEYGLDDIERYFSGKMTASEMHAIEKAALKDPFLSDAMEGYEEVDFAGAKEQLHSVGDKLNTKQEEPIQYGFDDIEQYLEGKMPSSERHTMEKVALKEPFLSDAIEGYEQADLKASKQHLTNIETAILGEEKEDTKIIAMKPAANNKIWLRIAAAIIIMVGVGGTLWLSNKEDVGGGQLAANDKPAAIKEVPSTTTPPVTATIADSQNKSTGSSSTNSKADVNATTNGSSTVATLPPATASSGAEKVIAPPAKQLDDASAAMASVTPSTTNNWSNGENKDNRKETADKFVIAKNNTERFKVDSTAVAANLKKQEAKAYYNQQSSNKPTAQNRSNGGYDYDAKNATAANTNAAISNELRGRVVNTNGEPVPNAQINLNRNGQRFSTIRSDANGAFNYRSADTALNADIVAYNYSNFNATLNASTSNTITLQPTNNLSLSEEIVTQNIGQKSKQSTANATWGQPIGGIKSFEEYVSKKKENLKKKDTTEDGEEYVEALVELEFDVDRLGKPYNISVTNSNTVDSSTSNKAIQIVKEGPAWIADKKKKKAKVVIKM